MKKTKKQLKNNEYSALVVNGCFIFGCLVIGCTTITSETFNPVDKIITSIFVAFQLIFWIYMFYCQWKDYFKKGDNEE